MSAKNFAKCINFDLFGKLFGDRRCDKIHEHKQNTILILCGTFSPFHIGHIDPFEYFINEHNSEHVLAMYLLPSSDFAASKKLKGKQIKLNKRIEIIEKSLKKIPTDSIIYDMDNVSVCKMTSDTIINGTK